MPFSFLSFPLYCMPFQLTKGSSHSLQIKIDESNWQVKTITVSEDYMVSTKAVNLAFNLPVTVVDLIKFKFFLLLIPSFDLVVLSSPEWPDQPTRCCCLQLVAHIFLKHATCLGCFTWQTDATHACDDNKKYLAVCYRWYRNSPIIKPIIPLHKLWCVFKEFIDLYIL